MPKYAITVTPTSGNAYSIIGAVAKALAREGVSAAEIEAYKREAKSGTYETVLDVSMAWVNLEPS